MNRDPALLQQVANLENRMTAQDQLNEALVNKLEELTASHNQLVGAAQAMLAQINALALKVQALEEKP